MVTNPTSTTLAARCGRVGLTSTAGVAALLAVIALPAPIDPSVGRPPAPAWQPPAVEPAAAEPSVMEPSVAEPAVVEPSSVQPAIEPMPALIAPPMFQEHELSEQARRCASLASAYDVEPTLVRITRCGPIQIAKDVTPRGRRRCHAEFDELVERD
jgi:hypothetical protein